MKKERKIRKTLLPHYGVVDLRKEVSDRLRNMMEIRNVSSKQIIDIMKIPSPSIYHWRCGEVLPGPDVLYALACILDCSVSDFFPPNSEIYKQGEPEIVDLPKRKRKIKMCEQNITTGFSCTKQCDRCKRAERRVFSNQFQKK